MSTEVSSSDYNDAVESYQGWCKECCAFTHDSAEPDAEDYACPDCGNNSVVGAENALIMGLIEIGDD